MTKDSKLLAQLAERYLGKSWHSVLWPRLEIVGDIVILRRNLISDAHIDYGKLEILGYELLDKIKHAKSVWLADSPVREYDKTRYFIHLAGEPRSVTKHKEHGCLFMLDIRRTYFSPRLNFEHGWFASHVKMGESILNMFAGVGFFSIIPACKKKAYSLAVDLNPHAYKFLLRNILLNKVDALVEAVNGDAGLAVLTLDLKDRYDHVIMPFPEKALYYLPFAYRAVRDGGEIHVFLHHKIKGRSSDYSIVVKEIIRRLKCLKPFKHEIIRARLVRTVGPRLGQYIVSLKIWKRG